MNAAAETEIRDLTPEEQSRFEAAETQTSALTARIERARKLEAFERHSEVAEPDAGGPLPDQAACVASIVFGRLSN